MRSRLAWPMTYRRFSTFMLAALITTALLAALAFAQPALAKSYTMGPLRIAADVRPDGSLYVEEQRTFDFSGDFTFAYWDLDEAGSSGIEVIGVDGPNGSFVRTGDPVAIEQRAPGTFSVAQEGSLTRVTAYFRAVDERITLTVRYRVIGAVTRWADTGELYWKFIGDLWDLPVHDVEIGISLPTGKEPIIPGENVRAWAHGPFEGMVRINDTQGSSAGPIGDTVSVTVPVVPANTFVEARIAFPDTWLSQVSPGETAMLSAILVEEGRLAEEANATRARARLLAAFVLVGAVGGAVVAERVLPAATGVPVGVAIAMTAAFMGRRSAKANELHAKYEGLRNYLRDFSRLDEHPPMHVKLREHFLVLAVVFGIAREVIDQMRVRIPEVVNDPAFATAYWWAYPGPGSGDSPVGSLQSGFSSAASIASSEMSSSSGGGGGSSGGGGGGGGAG